MLDIVHVLIHQKPDMFIVFLVQVRIFFLDSILSDSIVPIIESKLLPGEAK